MGIFGLDSPVRNRHLALLDSSSKGGFCPRYQSTAPDTACNPFYFNRLLIGRVPFIGPRGELTPHHPGLAVACWSE